MIDIYIVHVFTDLGLHVENANELFCQPHGQLRHPSTTDYPEAADHTDEQDGALAERDQTAQDRHIAATGNRYEATGTIVSYLRTAPVGHAGDACSNTSARHLSTSTSVQQTMLEITREGRSAETAVIKRAPLVHGYGYHDTKVTLV
ncbi:hypothetical protein ON010_g11404 [Phytophthora cinnamomi]|nr:hypothetical protein ON010_g11404 [Phytophthora cinnamomi]